MEPDCETIVLRLSQAERTAIHSDYDDDDEEGRSVLKGCALKELQEYWDAMWGPTIMTEPPLTPMETEASYQSWLRLRETAAHSLLAETANRDSPLSNQTHRNHREVP